METHSDHSALARGISGGLPGRAPDTPAAGTESAADRLCRAALHHEACAWPKPGLVSPRDAGSHRDMDIGTFLRSIDALHGTFSLMARAGAEGAPFSALQAIGVAAEARMLLATGGINTHRGAIFNLGLLVAADALRTRRPDLLTLSCGQVVAHIWGDAIGEARRNSPESHGNTVFRRYASGGARAEAMSGFPTVYRFAVPVLGRLLAAGHDRQTALIGTLLALVERVDDSNLLWRGGEAGLHFAQAAARRFNRAGGVGQSGWREALCAMHDEFVARNLSPGGSADLVAVAWVACRLDAAQQDRGNAASQ